jgi:predicted membrane channel-forming protein YqfA (hemolysin III family)
VAGLAPLLGWLLTLPRVPPFAAGHGWGNGCLLGGVAALLGAWAAWRGSHGQNAPLAITAGVVAPLFAATIAVAAALLWLVNSPVDALIGVACGWFAATFLLWESATRADLSLDATPGPPGEAPAAARALLTGSGFCVTLCALAALGVYRDGVTTALPHGTWDGVALGFAVAIPLLVLISAVVAPLFSRANRPPGHEREVSLAAMRGAVARTVIVALPLLWLANLLAMKVADETAVFNVVLCGLIVGGLVWWLQREAQPLDGSAGPPAVVPLAVLVTLGGFMAAYQMLQGFGSGLFLLAAWSVPALAMSIGQPAESAVAASNPAVASSAAPLLRVLIFGAVLVLYRLFNERFKADLHGMALTDHYVLFAMLAGAILPAAVGRLLWRDDATTGPALSSRGLHLATLIIAVLLTLGALAAGLVLWGAKIALGLFFGLALACVSQVAMAVRARAQTAATNEGIAMVALGIALALAQWTHRALPLAELSRTQRLRLLVYIACALFALLLIADYGSRLWHWLEARNHRAARPSRA